jgi:TetR/AcrR family transcriptional repressor of bet genes
VTAIDRDERRRRIAEITVDVIAREGLEAATIRRIAAELNGHTKLITHYFADKEQLLLWAYDALAAQWERQIEAVVQRDPADLLGCLYCMSPTDELQLKLWRVYVAFWDWSARNNVVADLQRKYITLALQRIVEIIRARNGERPDLESISERLNAVVQGLAIQALMDRDKWSPDRIRQRLAEEVDLVLGVPTS